MSNSLFYPLAPPGTDAQVKDLVNNWRLVFQVVIQYGGITNPMDLRVLFECLMLDNRFKQMMKDPAMIRLLSTMYGWSDVPDGLRGNNQMTETGKKFATHVFKRLWEGKYCVFCGHYSNKPFKLSYDQAVLTPEIRLAHIRSLFNANLCKSCINKVMVNSSSVHSMGTGRAPMLRASITYLPYYNYNGGNWWLRAGITRCMDAIADQVGNIDKEIEEAKKKVEELKKKKSDESSYGELLHKLKPDSIKKRKAEDEDEEDGEEDMHADKKKIDEDGPRPNKYTNYELYYKWCKYHNVEIECPDHNLHYDLYKDWMIAHGREYAPRKKSAHSILLGLSDNEEEMEVDRLNAANPHLALGSSSFSNTTPARPPPFTPSSSSSSSSTSSSSSISSLRDIPIKSCCSSVACIISDNKPSKVGI